MLRRWLSLNSTIMFDVGAAGLRACQVAGGGGRLRLVDALQIESPAQEDLPLDRTPTIDAARLSRVVGQGAFRGRDVGLILSPPEVQFHALSIAPQLLQMSPERVEAALTLEVTRETRQEAGELELRFWPMPSGHREGVNVMCVSVPRATLNAWSAALEQCGASLRRVDVSPCALARVAAASVGREDGVWGVLDLGARRAVLTLLIGDTPVYVRSIAVSGDTWSKRIADAFEISTAEAESIKRTFGLNSPVAGGLMRADDLESHEDIGPLVFSLLNDSVQSLIRSINQCFGYVLENYPRCSASRLVLAGGGALTPGLCEYLQEFLDLRVDRIDPTSVIPNASAVSADERQFIAFGGALLDLEAVA